MNTDTPKTQQQQGMQTARRLALTAAITEHASNPNIRSYALARALDGLNLNELEQLLDELGWMYGRSPGRPGGKTSPEK